MSFVFFDIHTFLQFFLVFRVPPYQKKVTCAMYVYQTGRSPSQSFPVGSTNRASCSAHAILLDSFAWNLAGVLKPPALDVIKVAFFWSRKNLAETWEKMLCFCGSRGWKPLLSLQKRSRWICFVSFTKIQICKRFWWFGDYLRRMGSMIKHNYA